MRIKINLQKIIAPSIFLTIFIFLVSLTAWILIYYIHPDAARMNGNAGNFAELFLPANSFFAQFLTLGLAGAAALLITQLNNKYAYINTRSFLHTLFFLLLSVCFIKTHGNYLSYFASLLVLFSIYLFFDNYNNDNDTEAAFLGFILFGISVFIIPQYLLLIPFFWIGLYQIKMLSPRTFFASIFGFIIPWLAIFIIYYASAGKLDYRPEFLYIFNNLEIIRIYKLHSLVYAVFLLITSGIVLFNVASRTNRESIKTRKMLYFFQIIGFGLLLLAVFFPSNLGAFIPLALAFFSIIASYVFTFQRSLFFSVLFILLCVATVIFAVLQLIY